MVSQKDTVLGRLAVERGYLTRNQVDEAFEIQRKMHGELGLDQPLVEVLIGKHWLTADQTHELRKAAAVETGEARLVAGYEAISKLGQGGMGAVYKARRVGTSDLVALKILPPSLADKQMIARFRRESEIVRKLHHRNIVGCIEFGFDKRRKVHFCALELVEGEDLGKYLRRKGRLSEDEAVSIAQQIAAALQHAYYNALVHRDVKPENIMVTADGTAKLLDLGLARPANQEATRLTESGMFVGSPYYASPEQAVGEKEVDTRSDIYSLGATLYHMVTGKPPFEGTTALAILRKHVTEKLPWPAEVNPELSDGLCEIIAKMMEKSPEDRYQMPNDLNRDLDLLVESERPKVHDAAFKNSSVKVPAVRPKRRRRPSSRTRIAGERERKHREPAERRRRDSARAHRREAGREAPGKASGWSALPTGAKVGIPVAGVLVVAGLAAILFGGKEPGTPGPKSKTPKRQPKPTVKVPPPKPREAETSRPKREPPAERVKKPALDRKAEDPFAELRRESEERMARLLELQRRRAALMPGAWAEVEGGTGHTASKGYSNASGGRAVGWFGEQKTVYVDLSFAKAAEGALMYLRYSRHSGSGQLDVYLGPVEATSAEAPGTRRLGRMKLRATGGWTRFAWISLPAGDVKPGEYRLFLRNPGGNGDSGDLDLVGIVPGTVARSWSPPNTFVDGDPVGVEPPATAAGPGREAVFRPPTEWIGAEKESTKGNPYLIDGRPVWRLDRLWPDNPWKPANYVPLPYAGKRWNGHTWWTSEHQHGGQPSVSFSKGKMALSTRSTWTAKEWWHKTPALVFIANAGGLYRVEFKAAARIFEGAESIKLWLLRLNRSRGRVTGVHYVVIPKGETRQVKGLTCRLDAGEELALVPRFLAHHQAGNCDITDLTIVHRPARDPGAVTRPSPPPDAASFGGHRYKLFTEKRPWDWAKAFCEAQGGHLVTITSNEENSFVTGLARGAGEDVWIGCTDDGREGRWTWVTREPFEFSAWDERQPDNGDGVEHWGAYWHGRDYSWNDCRPAWRLFICEWEPAAARKARAGTLAARAICQNRRIKRAPAGGPFP